MHATLTQFVQEITWNQACAIKGVDITISMGSCLKYVLTSCIQLKMKWTVWKRPKMRIETTQVLHPAYNATIRVIIHLRNLSQYTYTPDHALFINLIFSIVESVSSWGLHWASCWNLFPSLYAPWSIERSPLHCNIITQDLVFAVTVQIACYYICLNNAHRYLIIMNMHAGTWGWRRCV